MKQRIMGLLAAAVLPCAVMSTALATEAVGNYPDKPIHIIVPYPPGGSTDILARALGQSIGESLNQSVIVENRPGASGNIGASFVAKSPADGYTLFLGTSTALSVNPSLYAQLPYDPVKDFAPIVLATQLPSLVVTTNSLPVHSMQELTDYLKQSKTAVNYASSGNGTPAHLGGELYKRMAGVNANHVPYKGGAPALTDLVGGQTSYMFAILPEAMPLVKGGQLRALAVTTAQRLSAYPDLPTVAESGVPGYELIGWYAFLAPAGTPKPIVDKLNTAFNKGLQDPGVRRKLMDMGFEIAGGPPEKLSDMMRSERTKWKQVIDAANIRIE